MQVHLRGYYEVQQLRSRSLACSAKHIPSHDRSSKMDPISIIASTAGTVGFALRTSRMLYELVDGTLDAPKEVFAVSREAKAFASVLTSLQSLIQDGTLREEGVISLQVPLDNCLQTITTLAGKIQPHIKTSGDAKKSKWRGFTWTFKREDVRNLCSRLAQSNMTLNTAIIITNTYVISWLRFLYALMLTLK